MQAARGEALNAQADGAAAPRQLRVLLAVAAAVYVIDLVTKAIVVATLSGHAPLRLLGGLLTLRVLRNSGAAFSIGTSMTAVFTVIAVSVIVVILFGSRRLRSVPWAVTLGLLLGGAAGNLTDRLARSPGVFRGDVVDWVQLPHWPVFNIADSAIVCGGALAVLLSAWGWRWDGTREAPARRPVRTAPGTPRHGETGTVPTAAAAGPARASSAPETAAPDRPVPGIPVQNGVVHHGFPPGGPAQQRPADGSPAQDSPAQEDPAQDSPAQDGPAQDSPAQDSPAQDSRA